VPAGAHTIKIDNLGTDWITVSNYVFTNAGSPLSTYVLHAANNKRAAGWILNNNYNWQYLKNNGGTAPAVINGASIIVPGMENGMYKITFFNCTTGLSSGGPDVTVTGNNLTVALPNIAWDMAFTATNRSLLPVTISKFYGENINGNNNLYISIATAVNIKSVMIQRAANPVNFTGLGTLDISKGIAGNHIYVDGSPLKGNNFYRLKIIDNDGTFKNSQAILLRNTAANVALYPNPVKDDLNVSISGLNNDNYTVTITDAAGRKVHLAKYHIAETGASLSIPLKGNAAGVYLVKVSNTQNQVIAESKIIK
jgi:hypothetical protein